MCVPVAALKQLLLAQEDWWRGARGARPAGARLLRTTSLRTATVPGSHAAPAAAALGSPENGRDEGLPDRSAGDTGYLESSDDYSNQHLRYLSFPYRRD